MERDAARFYREAAEHVPRSEHKQAVFRLAQWEKRHIQVFADMKGRFAEQAWDVGRFDLDRVNVAQLDVPPAVFDEHSDPAKELAGNETRSEVFNLALKKERYTIGYYTALTEFSHGARTISSVIKDILQEEKRHVRILLQSLKQATG